MSAFIADGSLLLGQGLLDSRPLFVFKSGEITGRTWELNLCNRGMNIKPGTFGIECQSAGVEIERIDHEIEPAEGKDKIKIQGHVTADVFSASERRIKFSFHYQDTIGDKYEQSVLFDSDWKQSIIGDS